MRQLFTKIPTPPSQRALTFSLSSLRNPVIRQSIWLCQWSVVLFTYEFSEMFLPVYTMGVRALRCLSEYLTCLKKVVSLISFSKTALALRGDKESIIIKWMWIWLVNEYFTIIVFANSRYTLSMIHKILTEHFWVVAYMLSLSICQYYMSSRHAILMLSLEIEVGSAWINVAIAHGRSAL